MNWERWQEFLTCTSCRSNLLREDDALRCSSCAATYLIVNGVPHFLNSVRSEYADVYHARSVRTGLRGLFSPSGFFSAATFVDDRQQAGQQNFHGALDRFLKNFSTHDLVVDVGSGSRRLTRDILNVDVEAFPGVDMVAGGDALPFASGAVSGVVLQSVVELAPNPRSFIDEIWRVLKSGGLFFIEAPFVFPRHNGPDNYRWTQEGLASLCCGFVKVESGISIESGSALGAAVFAFGDERFCKWPPILRGPAYASLWMVCSLVRQLDRWPAASDRRSLYGAAYFVGGKS